LVLSHAETLNFAVGLAGETGELIDLLKKKIFHGHTVPEEKIISELGDVLWYVAALAESLGVPLDYVAQANVAKLRKRYPDGFSIQHSQERKDTK
jgi:NTP pyrophosphatase (non-canonical NTP hydrolase)